MKKTMVPVRRRVRDNVRTTISKEINGKAAVSTGDEVSVETVIGNRKQYKLHKISVPKAKVSLKEGAKIEKNQEIAKIPGMFGFSVKSLTAPAAGEIVKITADGEITIREEVGQEKVTAGCWGKVVSVTDQEVKIESIVMEISGAAGTGGSAEGFLQNLAKSAEMIMPQSLDKRVANSILCGGSLLTRETLEKAQALGAKGLIAGGINYRDFAALKKQNAGFPVILVGGFGPIPMELIIPDGYAFIDADKARITIPKNVKLDTSGSEKTEDKEETPLAKGLEVRVISFTNLGELGTVKSFTEDREELESGLRDVLAEVQVGSKTLSVPLTNLEAVE